MLIRSVLDGFQAWRIVHQPVLSSLRQAPNKVGCESLGRVGREIYADRLKELRAKVEASEATANDLLKLETGLWLDRQDIDLNANWVPPSQRLMLAAIGLLPSFLNRRPTHEDYDNLAFRISAMMDWFEEEVTYLPVLHVEAIAKSLRNYSSQIKTLRVAKLLDSFAERICACTHSPGKKTEQATRTDIHALLAAHGVTFTLKEAAIQLSNLVRNDIAKLAVAAKANPAEEPFNRPKERNPNELDEALKWANHVLISSLQDEFPNPTAEQISAIIAPPLIETYVTDGLFLPGWSAAGDAGPGLAILPSAFAQPEFIRSCSGQRALLRFLSHEVYPGHAYHLNEGRKGPLQPFLTFGEAPVTFEGFASLTEGLPTIIRGREQNRLLHRLRRLIPVALALESCINPSDSLLEDFATRLRALPSSFQAFLERFVIARLGWALLPYAIGMLEIEKLGGLHSARVRAILRHLGPASPRAIAVYQALLTGSGKNGRMTEHL